MYKSAVYKKTISGITNLGLGSVLLILSFTTGIKSASAADAVSDALDRQIIAREQQIARFNAENPINGMEGSTPPLANSFTYVPPAPPAVASGDESLQNSIRDLQIRLAQLEAAQAANAGMSSSSPRYPLSLGNVPPNAYSGVPVREGCWI